MHCSQKSHNTQLPANSELREHVHWVNVCERNLCHPQTRHRGIQKSLLGNGVRNETNCLRSHSSKNASLASSMIMVLRNKRRKHANGSPCRRPCSCRDIADLPQASATKKKDRHRWIQERGYNVGASQSVATRRGEVHGKFGHNI